MALSAKTVNRVFVQSGDVLTYTISLVNVGGVGSLIRVTDTIPLDTSYVAGSAYISPATGTLTDVGGIFWSGTLADTALEIGFGVVVEGQEPEVITNRVSIDDGFSVVVREAITIANGYRIYLPVILRQ